MEHGGILLRCKLQYVAVYDKSRGYDHPRKELLTPIQMSTRTSEPPSLLSAAPCDQQYKNTSFISKISPWLPSSDDFPHPQLHTSRTQVHSNIWTCILKFNLPKCTPLPRGRKQLTYGPSHKCLPSSLTDKCSHLNIYLTRVLAFLAKAERREAL